MQYLEYQHQVSLFTWARHPLILKQYPELKWLYANMNTQKLNKLQAGRWKAAGGTAGIPDIFLPVKNKNYCGLYIELKIKPNNPTKGQLQFLGFVSEQGYLGIVCYDWLTAKQVIEDYLKAI